MPVDTDLKAFITSHFTNPGRSMLAFSVTPAHGHSPAMVTLRTIPREGRQAAVITVPRAEAEEFLGRENLNRDSGMLTLNGSGRIEPVREELAAPLDLIPDKLLDRERIPGAREEPDSNGVGLSGTVGGGGGEMRQAIDQAVVSGFLTIGASQMSGVPYLPPLPPSPGGRRRR